MDDKIKISLAESAIEDLEDILNYYSEQKVPHVGKRFVSQVLEDFEGLKNQPDVGRIVPEFKQNRLKELIRSPFRIVYLRDSSKFIVFFWFC